MREKQVPSYGAKVKYVLLNYSIEKNIGIRNYYGIQLFQ